MLASHHSHSGQFCKHAVGTLEEVVQAAINAGFKVYGLTEHVPRYRIEDLYPEEAQLSPSELAQSFDLFIQEAHRLKSVYAGQITLLVGLETDRITQNDLDQLDLLLIQYGDRIEYIVGSIHHCNGIPIDFDRPTFERAVQSFATGPGGDAQTSFLNAYFDAQLELMARFHPEIIGHFDLCRLYTPSLSFAGVWDRVERNVRFAIEYGAAFELNAAAFRKGWETAYPGRDVVELIKSLGGIFVLSDDSHGPGAVGLNYDRLHAYATDMKIGQIFHLCQMGDKNKAGRTLHPGI